MRLEREQFPGAGHDERALSIGAATQAAVAVSLIALASAAVAECVDINADPVERLVAIVYINEGRVGQIVAGRPWTGLWALTGLSGVGRIGVANP